MTEKRLLALKEVAKILNMNPEVLRRWLRSGKLPGVKVGSDWRVNSADLDKFFLNSNGKLQHSDSFKDGNRKMCYRFPKWIEFSGLPTLLNKHLGLAAWPVFKKLIELDFELGRPDNRRITVSLADLSERTGYSDKDLKTVLNGLKKLDYIVLEPHDENIIFEIVTPIKSPKLVLDIAYEKGGIQGAPQQALTNSCMRRFLETSNLND